MTSRSDIRIGICTIVVRDGRLLLGKRKNAYGDGMWGLPGGHLEFGEEFEPAAARELEEETSLCATQLQYIGIYNEPQDNIRHYIHIGFQAKDAVGEAKLCEPEKCYGWQWFDLKNLPENILKGHWELIKRLSV